MPGRGWAGPNPLLLLATVVLYGAAVVLSDGGGTAPAPEGTARLASSETNPAGPQSVQPGGEIRRLPVAETPPRRIGVATFNSYRQLSLQQTVSDARKLANRRGVDVIGWQEAYRMPRVRPALRKLGWRTAWGPGGADELAISWRTDKFAFVRADRKRLAPGVDDSEDFPVSDRYALRVVLRDRTTKRRLSVITTHLPPAIESEHDPGRWRLTPNADRARRQLEGLVRFVDNSPGRWTVVTTDLNLDVRTEQRIKPYAGPSVALPGHLTSSYEQLGVRGVGATHPVSGRHIDYVYADTPGVRRSRIEFAGHGVVRGLHSDHRPLVAQLLLR